MHKERHWGCIMSCCHCHTCSKLTVCPWSTERTLMARVLWSRYAAQRVTRCIPHTSFVGYMSVDMYYSHTDTELREKSGMAPELLMPLILKQTPRPQGDVLKDQQWDNQLHDHLVVSASSSVGPTISRKNRPVGMMAMVVLLQKKDRVEFATQSYRTVTGCGGNCWLGDVFLFGVRHLYVYNSLALLPPPIPSHPRVTATHDYSEFGGHFRDAWSKIPSETGCARLSWCPLMHNLPRHAYCATKNRLLVDYETAHTICHYHAGGCAHSTSAEHIPMLRRSGRML